MIRPVSWMLLLLAALPTAPSARAGARGEIVYQTGFEEADCLRSWEGGGDARIQIVPGRQGSKSLRVDRPAAEGPGYRSVRVRLPVEKLRGARVKVEGLVKAEGVERPSHPGNGVKCMLFSVSPGGPRWAQQDNVFGTFDWKPVHFAAEVPADATEAWLDLGLEQTTGRAWFDDLKVTVIGFRRKIPAARPAGPVNRWHDLPRLRGAMINPQVTEADLRVLGGQWGANHVRWQLLWGGFPHGPADSADVAAYDRWLESALVHLDRLLPVCREVGLRVVIDMHTPPGGRNPSSQYRMFSDKKFQEAFVAAWEKIALRYRGQRTVWGFDLVNEPVEGVVEDGLLDWHGLATLAARKVRDIDPDHAIIVEPAPWGGPEGLDWFEPLDVPGVVYSVHMYAPFQFTHQGIHGNPKGVVYPGTIQGKRYDRRELERVLRPAIDFQRDYGVHIYLGEFSAIRWAPGQCARDYLRDCIDIFEEHGWDWAYHAFREWDGWSVEHGPDPEDHNRTTTPTSRQELLRSWYGKNRK